MDAARPFAEECLDHGATPEQLHEVLTLVAGLGVHSFMEGSQSLVELAQERGIHPATEAQAASELVETWTGEGPTGKPLTGTFPGSWTRWPRVHPRHWKAS
ncbi:hypothetical protein ACFFX0_29615 [Citricoccus parietis]|uniref:Uncharacterized protein n=1 Tax=Citricoccus parietis TaxID=592307 RepID=A0ABV5G850_9MICC